MSADYFFFYAEANIVCILIFGILLVHDTAKGNRQEKQIKFDYALLAHILYFISDIFWAAVINGTIRRTRASVAMPNFFNFILLPAIAYEWFMFAAATENMQLRRSRSGRMLIRLPWIVMSVVMIISYAVHPDYWISAEGELNGLYYPMFLLAPMVYVLWGSIYSLRKAKKAEYREQHRLYTMIGAYPLMVVVFGVIQTLALNAPLFCFACTLMMITFYIHSMDDQISIDPLTRLNNRNQLYRYIAQEGTRRREGKKIFVVMIDVNDFKMINDTYGHDEGDKALVLVAESLKGAVERLKMPTFLGRYGGDEFIMIMHAEREEELSTVAYEVRRQLDEKRQAQETPYFISLGIGYDELRKEDDSFEECLQRADQKLYVDKELEKRKINRKQ